MASSASASLATPEEAVNAASATTSDLTSRITAVCDFLKDYENTDETRLFIIRMMNNGGQYCAVCSPLNLLPGSCGHTCALLRSREGSFKLPEPDRRRFHLDHTLYVALLQDMLRKGCAVNTERLALWEERVKDLRVRSYNASERVEAHGWRKFKTTQKVEGMKEDWDFASAWGKRTALEEYIASNETASKDVAAHGSVSEELTEVRSIAPAKARASKRKRQNRAPELIGGVDKITGKRIKRRRKL